MTAKDVGHAHTEFICMTTPASELREAAETLRASSKSLQERGVQSGLAALEGAASKAGRAWSGSWIGHHANIYYRGLTRPPAGAHFSSEWGLQETFAPGTRGDWVELDPDAVKEAIVQEAGRPDLEPARSVASAVRQRLADAQSAVVSILEIECRDSQDPFLTRLLEEAKKLQPLTVQQVIRHLRPSGQYTSRDSVAVHQGLWTPPHLDLLAEVIAIRSPGTVCEELAALSDKAASHLERLEQRRSRGTRVGTGVFIEHGRSPIWKDLRDFLRDRLGLPWDEFNRVPVAGVTNIARLSQMLDDAALAFVVLTAEDETKDGGTQARMNVIHEVGLFQGRLGFTRAIVLLEDGCAEFSNIQGLGQIRFPTGNLGAKFEEIRQVLEREGLIGQ